MQTLCQMFSELPAESYFTLAHCADQTHAGDCKAEQGYTCMDIVDTDRWAVSSCVSSYLSALFVFAEVICEQLLTN